MYSRKFSLVHCVESTARVPRWNTVAVQTREILQVRDHPPVVPVATAADRKTNPFEISNLHHFHNY